MTELQVEPVDSITLSVSWELPQYPNGPISHYLVHYREQNGPQDVPLVLTNDYKTINISYEKVCCNKHLDMNTFHECFSHSDKCNDT